MPPAQEQLARVGHAADLRAFLEILPDHARQLFAEDRACARRDEFKLRLLASEQIAAAFERADEHQQSLFGFSYR